MMADFFLGGGKEVINSFIYPSFMVAFSGFFWSILLIGRTTLNCGLNSEQNHQGVWCDLTLLDSF